MCLRPASVLHSCTHPSPMGSAQSTMSYKDRPFGTSVEVEPASGDSGAVRRQLKHKDALHRTANEGVLTLYDGWQ